MVLYFVGPQVGKKFAKTPTEDKDYLRGKSMLTKLDLQKYEKNFKKGMLTDSTLHLVNDRFVTATCTLTFSSSISQLWNQCHRCIAFCLI